jgi:MFS family permease
MAGVGLSISGAFQILLPVAPVLVERVGPHGAGGAATAALFSGAVAGEVLTPWLMSRWSAARLLIAGQLIYAIFSLAYVYQGAPAWIFVGAAGARGVGFGIAIVVSVVLVGDSGPATERGRSMGVFGLALSLPGIVARSASGSSRPDRSRWWRR